MSHKKPESPPQKLLKMSAGDHEQLTVLTLAAIEWVRERQPDALPHMLPTTSHVFRLLLRRAHAELAEINAGTREDTGLVSLIAAFGGMQDPEPPAGYFVPPDFV